MADNDKTFEAYFAGKMNSAQANDFLTALQENTELKERYDLFLAVKKSASMIERDRMRAELEGLVTKKKNNSSLVKILTWSGILAVFLIIAFFAYRNLKAPSTDQIFALNYEMYQAQMSRGEASDILKEEYSAGNYETYIKGAINKEATPEENMMLAHAYIQEEQFAAAAETLTKISDESALRDQKYWYLGLVLLKQNQTERARINFNKLLSLSNYKKAETEKILSKL